MRGLNQSYGVSKADFSESFKKSNPSVKFQPPSRFHSSFNYSKTKFLNTSTIDDGNKFNSSISSAFGNGTINQKNFEQAQFMNPSVFSSSRSSTYCNDNTFVKPTSFAVSRSSIIGGYTQNNSSQLTFNSSFQTMNGRIQQIKDPTQFLSNYQQTMPPNTSNFGGGFGSSNNSQRYFNNSFSFATNPSINNERKTSFKNDLKDEPMNMDPPSLKSFGSVKQNWLSFENSQNSLNKYKR